MMKNFIVLVASMLMTLSALAQNNYLFPSEGKTLVYKAEVSSTAQPAANQTMYSTVKVDKITSDSVLVSTDTYSDEDLTTKVASQSIRYTIKDGFYISHMDEIMKDNLKQFTNVKVVGGETESKYPMDPKVGDVIDKLAMDIQGDMMGNAYTINYSVNVSSFEQADNVETEMGEYDCLLLRQNSVVAVMGQENKSMASTYYSIGVGVVKVETSMNGGMVKLSSELIRIID
ncbi:MAG: hypothetical protein WCS34_03460 [Bacteroidales bacterium]